MTIRMLINLQGSCHSYLQHEAEGVAIGGGRTGCKQTSGSCTVHLGVSAKLLSFPPSFQKNKTNQRPRPRISLERRQGKEEVRAEKGRAAETWTVSRVQN